jgi:ribonucleoside-diphosphate reductase alpha chain
MSAVQPFLSGAISKTVNMPESATIEDVEQLHMDAWKMGIKAIAIYRDNCKAWQPLSDKKDSGDKKELEAAVQTQVVVKAMKRELPRSRTARTFEFHIADLKGFVTVGEYEDGTPGELFVRVAKQGSTLSGLMDSFAISVSHGLQYGVPLKSYVKTLSNMSFAPSGITDDPEIRTASSLIDYIFRRLARDYLSFDDRLELGLASFDDLEAETQTNQTSLLEQVSDAPKLEETPKVEAKVAPKTVAAKADRKSYVISETTAPMCHACGNQTQRAGSCYVCSSCGATSGCS